jgi:hypothetical protein
MLKFGGSLIDYFYPAIYKMPDDLYHENSTGPVINLDNFPMPLRIIRAVRYDPCKIQTGYHTKKNL